MLLQQWRARSVCVAQSGGIRGFTGGLAIGYRFEFSRHLATPLDMLHTAVIRSLPGSTLSWKDSFQFRYLIAQEAQELGVARTARKYSVSYGKARYWADKLHGSNPGVHGGHRYQTLTQEAQLALEWTIFLIWEADPNLRDYQVLFGRVRDCLAKRVQDEARKAEEERLQQEAARRAQAQRVQDEAQKAAEERLQQEAARRAQKAKRVQAQRVQDEARKAEEERLQQEAARRAQAQRVKDEEAAAAVRRTTSGGAWGMMMKKPL
eukprot:g75597.t1